jgi:hypothetical protein
MHDLRRLVRPGGRDMGMIELRVAEDGTEILIYKFREIAAAVEMMDFLSGFLPAARFVIQPVPH